MIKLPFQHFERYREMVGLLYKYGCSDLIDQSGLADQLRMDHKANCNSQNSSHDWDVSQSANGSTPTNRISSWLPSTDPSPQELVHDLESMGPTFIKLGQMLSTRPDFLPESYCVALKKLQDNAEPVDTVEIFRVVEQELGQQPEYLFDEFDIEPLATASLGQVHRATMKDGRRVVVKVQRPGVAEQIFQDLDAMKQLADFCETMKLGQQYQLKQIVESLRMSLADELDYRTEALNTKTLAENLDEFESIVVPLPIHDLSTSRVLTMEYVEAQKITELSPCRLSKPQSCNLASELFNAFLHQVLVHGVFHADPHPGNVSLTDDDQIVLMDHGLVVKVSPRLQSSLIKLLLAICDGDGTTAAEVAEMIGNSGPRFDANHFRPIIERIVAENVNRSVDQINAGTALMSIQKAAGQNDLVMPQEVILLGRALLLLEGVVASLDPKFDPNAAIREQAMTIMQQHSQQKMTLSSLYQTFLESSEFVQQLPARANKLAELVTNNALEIQVNSIDETRFISGLHKVANRISAGLIIAAMIVAAALMMRLQTDWTILGYPAIAFGFLTLAALAGTVLVWRVVISDQFENK